MSKAPAIDCGSCNLCCTLLKVPDLNKPSGMTCWHTTVHGGCAVHAEKQSDPKLLACAQFKCVWLESQLCEEPVKRGTRGMRPDQIHVLFGPFDRDDPKLLYVHVDPEHKTAWKTPHVIQYMEEVYRRDPEAKFCIVIGDRNFAYEPQGMGA